MTMLDKAIKALEPFAAAYKFVSDGEPIEENVYKFELERAAEALAELRKRDAEIEQGFEEWWASRHPDPATDYKVMHRLSHQEAYRAGQLARIPSEVREALVEACRSAVILEETRAARSGLDATDDGYDAEAYARQAMDRAARYAKARAWLENRLEVK